MITNFYGTLLLIIKHLFLFYEKLYTKQVWWGSLTIFALVLLTSCNGRNLNDVGGVERSLKTQKTQFPALKFPQ